MENKPTLVEYLKAEPGYNTVSDSATGKQYLKRADGSTAAEFNGNAWQTYATQEEIVGYRNETAGAIPKLEKIASVFKPVVPRFDGSK